MEPSPQKKNDDPYPKMIIACIGITAVLLAIICMVLLSDYIRRANFAAPPPDPAAFEQMLEAPREAYSDEDDNKESP